MKTKLFLSLLAAAATCGLANAAETAYTTPVGYETVSVASGFNYLGVRLHESIVSAGTFETVGTSSVTDTGANFSAISANPAKTYVIEINDGSGIITEILGAAVSGDTITTVDNLSAAGVANGASYSIRPASTLSSVFGSANSAGLTSGFFGIAGADVVFVSNGSGGFDQYYYDDGQASWADSSSNPVNGSNIALVYTDSLIISANSGLSLVVSGEVKKTGTLAAVASGFSYLGSVYPVGATLSGTFDGAIASLDKGFFGIAGADVFFVSNGVGGFDQYYYDEGQASWADSSGNPVDGSTISLASGVIFSNEGSPINLPMSQPAFYSSL